MKTTRKALLLILFASLLAGTGQLLWKYSSFSLGFNLSSLFNPFLLLGIIFYFLATILMILSFREGELSVLHPFLATSYIWVTLIAPIFIPSEIITPPKIIGTFLVFFGVFLISFGGKKSNDNKY